MRAHHVLPSLSAGVALILSAPLASAQAAAAAPAYPIRLEYDSTSDSTTRSVELQHGRYFIHFHKPRVTVAVAYPGTIAPAEPDAVLIEFRTQSPQYAATNVLTLTAPGDVRVTAIATRSRVRTHIQTTDHTLTFALAAAELRPLLSAAKARMEVGGVRVDLKRAQLEALDRLLGTATPP